ARLCVETVDDWEDCGTLDALLETNRFLLAHGYDQQDVTSENTVLVPPVYVSRTARIENSVIGPHVSVAADAVAKGSIVKDSIISDGAQILDATLTGSLVGSRAVVRGRLGRVNVGDASEVDVE